MQATVITMPEITWDLIDQLLNPPLPPQIQSYILLGFYDKNSRTIRRFSRNLVSTHVFVNIAQKQP